MEKINSQEYRDDLAEQLKDLRSKGDEGKEDAKFLLNTEQGRQEYKDNEEFHHKEIKKFLGEKAETERRELHEAKISEMIKIVESLPFDYIPVPVSPNGCSDGVLLKIQGTEVAFLVGNDLRYCGSGYGIKAGGEKMFILCGCRNCGNYNEEFLESLKDTATKEKIKTIISRYSVGKNLGDDIMFGDAENVENKGSSVISNEVYSVLEEKGLLPTQEPSENEEKKSRESYEAEQKRKKEEREQEQEREKKDKELLTKVKSLNIDSQSDQIDQLIEQMSSGVCRIVTGNICHEVAGKIEGERKEIIENLDSKSVAGFYIISASTHLENKSNFHIEREQARIKLERNENDDLTFKYDGEKYRLIGARSGYNNSDLVLIGVLDEIKEPEGNLGRKTGSLELYTSLPFYKTIATALEKRILTKKSYSELLIDDRDFREKLEKEAKSTKPNIEYFLKKGKKLTTTDKITTSDTENIETLKLEWGPELGQRMSWDDARTKIKELNSKLAEGEKPWRLPTVYELSAEWEKTDLTPPAGFRNETYWSSTAGNLNGQRTMFSFWMGGGEMDLKDVSKEYSQSRVRCIRDLNN